MSFVRLVGHLRGIMLPTCGTRSFAIVFFSLVFMAFRANQAGNCRYIMMFFPDLRKSSPTSMTGLRARTRRSI
ncbi:hypothetical protein R3P38DRAFT_2988267, partial [Favolaschia claudopus]